CAPSRRVCCHSRTTGLAESTTGSSSGLARTRYSRNSAPTTLVLCRASVPTMTFSIAVISGKSRMFWNVRAMPIRLMLYGLRPLIRRPSNVTEPAVGLKTPVITLKQVVFPAPFGPMRPRISPSNNLKLTWSSATTPPKRSVTSSKSSSTRCSDERMASGIASGNDIDRRLLSPVVQLAGASTAGQQALRTHDHDDHQHHADQDRSIVGEQAEPLRQVGEQDRAKRHA